MAYQNTLIDVLTQDDFLLGRVVGEQKNKLQIEDQTGKRQRVNPKYVLAVHHEVSSAQASEEIRKLQTTIDGYQEEIDIPFLWESILDYEQRDWNVEELAEEFFGSSEAVHCSAIARALWENRVYFKPNKLLFTPRTRKEVEELVAKQKREEERRQRRERIFDQLKQLHQGKKSGEEDDEFAESLRGVEDFLYRNQRNEVAQLLGQLSNRKTARETGLEVLDKTGRVRPDTDRTLLLQGITAEFPEHVERQAQEFPPFEPSEDRRDLTGLTVFSIDDPDTKEIDDALSVRKDSEGTLEVGIHIADPAAFIHKDDCIDKTAAERPLTLYLPTVTVPMLPEKLGTDLASLNAQEKRPALSFLIKMSPEAEVLDYEVVRSSVCVDENLTYDQADTFLTGTASEPEGIGQALEELTALATHLQTAREEQGALRIFKPEVKVEVIDGEIYVKELDLFSESRRAVSEFMILANYLMARFALRQDVPIIYRTQAPPSNQVPVMDDYDPAVFAEAVKHLQKSHLSTFPENHAGLGLDLYTQCSSPLRRYADLVIQRQVTAFLGGQTFPYEVNDLVHILGAADRIEGDNKRLEREVRRYWVLEYLRRYHNDQEVFEATILPGGRRGQEAELCPYYVRGRLSESVRDKPGTVKPVTIQKVRPSEDLLTLRPAG